MDNLELAIVDVETTGTSAMYDRIIEVAVLRISQGQLVDQFSSLVDPERTLPHHIEQLTGIRNADLRGAPTFREIKDNLHNLLEGCILVAHNARFDYAFIRREFEREQCVFSAKCLCTARLSRMLFPGYRRHNLDSIIARFRISCTNRHRAFDDARVLWDFVGVIKESVEEAAVKEALSRILKTPAFPPLLDESVVQALPESAGVYIFYGVHGEVLYVGKGANIRSRAVSHFLNDRHSIKETALRRQVADVTAQKTAGELGALLLQSALIKELAPMYNRRPAAKKRRTNSFKVWPFPGPVLIEERDYFQSEGEIFILDQWSILGWFKYDECGVRNVRNGDQELGCRCYPTLTRYFRQSRTAPIKQITKEEADSLLEKYGATG